MSPVCVCIFARVPLLGRVKTRLAAHLGDETALSLYQAFLGDALQAADESQAEVFLHLSEAPESAEGALALEQLGPLARPPWRLQTGGDLGERMAAAFALEAAAGARTVAIVGSDLPLITASDLDRCLDLARGGQPVLAPTPDGGFWCVAGPSGLDWASSFAGVAWSSSQELAACQAHLAAQGTPAVRGPMGLDVDDAADLQQAARALLQAPETVGRQTREVLARLPEFESFRRIGR